MRSSAIGWWAASDVMKGAKASKGLRIERIHTTPGVHPYDEVAWERRDVVMANWRDGSVNFEQRGHELTSTRQTVGAAMDISIQLRPWMESPMTSITQSCRPGFLEIGPPALVRHGFVASFIVCTGSSWSWERSWAVMVALSAVVVTSAPLDGLPAGQR